MKIKTVREGDLLFNVGSAVGVERFDDATIHDPKSTMKRIDFIIETTSEYIFLEVKDPDMPGAKNPAYFKAQLTSGNFIPEIAGQCRDTLLFTMLRQKIEKPIIYVVLVCMESLDAALLLDKTEALKKALPLTHKSWPKSCVDSCVILKLDAYKKRFGDSSVWRHSDYE